MLVFILGIFPSLGGPRNWHSVNLDKDLHLGSLHSWGIIPPCKGISSQKRLVWPILEAPLPAMESIRRNIDALQQKLTLLRDSSMFYTFEN